MVTADGEYMVFKQEGNIITLSNETTDEILENDPNPGSGFGGGGGTGGTVTTPTPTPTPTGSAQSTPQPTGQQPFFPDTEGHWAQSAIEDIAAKGIIQGKEDGDFHPDETVTRAEWVAMAVRALEVEEHAYQGGFVDVSAAAWYADAVQTALDIGLVSSAQEFRPDDLVTREEMSKILSIMAKRILVIKDLPQGYQADFTDMDEVSKWAVEYVNQVQFAGLMTGMEDGSFQPQGNATRAEAATVIDRMLQKASQ